MPMKRMSDSTSRKGRKKTLPDVPGFKPMRYDEMHPNRDPYTVQRTKKGDTIVNPRKKRPKAYKKINRDNA